MFSASPHRYLVPYDGSFRIADALTHPASTELFKGVLKEKLSRSVRKLGDLQRVLYADNRYSVLLVFQAMDAAGKDGTIRKVMSGINPAGCQVFSFKKPSSLELDHDFLWRTAKRLPERGRIGVFNRSYYEEVLVVRVHPEILEFQRLPWRDPDIWPQRFRSIAEHEEHLARNGTIILKFWLNVSREEQKTRFLSRLDEPEKNWKFAAADVRERGYWDAYMQAYEEALNATSKPWAPWYAIPADNKHYMRATVAAIVEQVMQGLDLRFPSVGPEERARFAEMREILENEP